MPKKKVIGRPRKPISEKVVHINTCVLPGMIKFLDEEAENTEVSRSSLISSLIDNKYGKRFETWLKKKKK